MQTLYLSVKKVYFDSIRIGTKGEEYRLVNDYWRKRLVGREYGEVVISLGYPAAHEVEKRMSFEYKGYEKRRITHPHFGPDEVEVFAIDLSGRIS